MANASAVELTLEKQSDARFSTIKGENFNVTFDNESGTIYNLNYGGETIIADGNGPKLDAFRAFTNNDNWFYGSWFENGLHNLKHKATASKVIKRKDGSLVLFYTVESQAPNAAKILGGTSSGKNKVEELTDKPSAKTASSSRPTRHGPSTVTVPSNCKPASPPTIQAWYCHV